MNEPTLPTLVQRLDRLERQGRWWRALAVTSLSALGFFVLLGAGNPGSAELQARKFTLVDPTGEPAASLAFNSDGLPFLSLWGGNSSLVLSLEHNRASMTLRGSTTLDGIETGLTILDTLGLQTQRLSDPATIKLVLNPIGVATPVIAITDKRGDTVWKAP
jgi:hypothetical protein